MPEVAHMGQEECENTSSSRLHHFLSIISFLVEFPVKWAAIPVMWATPEWRTAINLLPSSGDRGTD